MTRKRRLVLSLNMSKSILCVGGGWRGEAGMGWGACRGGERGQQIDVSARATSREKLVG